MIPVMTVKLRLGVLRLNNERRFLLSYAKVKHSNEPIRARPESNFENKI